MATKESKHHQAEIGYTTSGTPCVRLVWPRVVTKERLEFMAQQRNEIVVRFTRHDVEGGYVAAALERLQHLVMNAVCVECFASRVRFEFSGYEADPREPHQIPACVDFVHKIDEYWPHWLHFAVKEAEHMEPLLLMLIASCEVAFRLGQIPLLDEEINELNDFVIGGAMIDAWTLNSAINRGHIAAIQLRDELGVDPDQVTTSRKAVLSVIRRAHDEYDVKHPPIKLVIATIPKRKTSRPGG